MAGNFKLQISDGKSEQRPTRKARRVLWVALLVVVLGGIVWVVLRPQETEPVYQGKKLSVWLEQYCRNLSSGGEGMRPLPTNFEALRDEAVIALHQIGTNAIPNYLKLMATRFPMENIGWRIPWILRIPWLSGAYIRQGSAATSNPYEAMLGFRLLGSSGKSAVAGLISVIQSSDNRISRYSAAYSLSFIGPAAKDALPALIQNFKDTDESVRDATVKALFAIAQDQKTYRWRPECVSVMMPALIQILKEPNTDDLRVIRLLGDLGGDAKNAVPALLPFLNNANVAISSATAVAIKSIDHEAAAKAGIK